MSTLHHDAFYEHQEEIKAGAFAEEPNCSHCSDTYEYEAETCPYCKPNREREDAERAMDFAKGN